MNKKIKVIELLNKIAKGEEIPNKIKILGIVFVWFEGSYRKEDANLEYITDYCRLDCMLNDEVEILEDNTEEIERIPAWRLATQENDYEAINDTLDLFGNKINELVRAIKEIRKEKNNV